MHQRVDDETGGALRFRADGNRLLDIGHIDSGGRAVERSERSSRIGHDVFFNLTNSSTALGQTPRQNTSTANYLTTIVGPRVAQFRIRVAF